MAEYITLPPLIGHSAVSRLEPAVQIWRRVGGTRPFAAGQISRNRSFTVLVDYLCRLHQYRV